MEELNLDLENKSKFNTSLATVYALANITNMLVISTIKNDIDTHYSTLLSYMKLLSGVETNEKIIIAQYQKWQYIKKVYHTIKQAKDQNMPIPRELLDTLHEWEIDLNMWKQKIGLGIEKRPDGRLALMD